MSDEVDVCSDYITITRKEWKALRVVAEASQEFIDHDDYTLNDGRFHDRMVDALSDLDAVRGEQ